MELFEAPTRAPEINRPGLFWLNTPSPLSLADLRGKVVLLDFWTFCCINCMHILPTLRRIETAFADEVMVIGVHSPKFAAEKDIENVRRAIARYGIQHPVIHDPQFMLWHQYDVHAWPTMVYIDPLGRILGQQSGEPDPLHLMNSVRDMLDHYEAHGVLQPKPFPFAAPAVEPTTLRFPAKIKPLPGPAKQWIIADSGHNQIAVLDDAGAEIKRYGSGRADCGDGDAQTASFNAPQGLVADEAFIYVADTGNHAIRRIDRANDAITTLAGTSERGMLLLNKFEKAMGRALASPWDLELKNHVLFFANAGTHQIGGLDLQSGQLRVVAGSGAENIQDGDVLQAQLAQTSGFAFNAAKDRLYFVDSETSSLRYIDMTRGRVETLIGTGLFDFGHQNGALEDATLQHCLGLCLLDDNHILIADSYNAAIRLVDLENKQVEDLDGNGWLCTDPLCLPFAEPAGICADGENRLLLADTNNHRIVEIRRDKGETRTWA